uniref:Uncharacterized protein n=1 Tax=Rhizophora mucronata TaxID=61149 RepID=A0A2P2PP84_RHIMU
MIMTGTCWLGASSWIPGRSRVGPCIIEVYLTRLNIQTTLPLQRQWSVKVQLNVRDGFDTSYATCFWF